MGYSKKPKGFRGSPEWRREWARLRREVLARSEGRCEQCGSNTGVVVHHMVPVHAGGAVLPPVEELAALCEPCHRYCHRHGVKRVLPKPPGGWAEYLEAKYGQPISSNRRPRGRPRKAD